MKIFLSTSFSNKVLPNGEVEPTYRANIQKILDQLEGQGHSVYCALREDGWKLNDLAPAEAFDKDILATRDCDVLVAIIRNNPVSAGMQFELGVAFALNKNIIVLSQVDDLPVPYINIGLLNSNNVKNIQYKSLEDVGELLSGI